MGKTRTAVISGIPEKTKAGKKLSKGRSISGRKQKRKKSLREEKGVKIPGLKGGERIVAVGGEIAEEEKEEKKEKVTKKEQKRRSPKARGKKYLNAKAKVDKTKIYSLAEAIKLVKETSYSVFNGTVELHLTVKKQGTTINVTLPHSTGKIKVIEIANDKTIEKLEKGKADYDVLLATAEMMPKLVPYAKILGPKGLMPNPKTGTIIKDKKDAKKFSIDKLTIKTEKKTPLIHTTVGKVDQANKELVENTEAILTAFGKKQIKKAVITATMGPGIRIQVDPD